MKKILFCMQALVASLLLTACLHDDNEVFDESAAQRIEKAVTADKALLESAPNGWELHLWTEPKYTGGGYTYLMKFKNGKVTVSADIAPAEMQTTSSYDVIQDAGPVLTINTFNTIFHHLSTPSMQDDDGHGQDFEFIIQRTTNDSIYLEGRKFGNKMVMTRIKPELNWKNHLEAIQQTESDMLMTYIYVVGTDTTFVNLSEERSLTTKAGQSRDSAPYYYTATGITLRAPVMVGGKQVQHFKYNSNALTLSCTDNGASAIVLKAALPKDYMNYADFTGTYDLAYYFGTLHVELVPAGDNKTFKLKGLSTDFMPTLTYNRASGTLSWNTQLVYTESNGHEIWLWLVSFRNGGRLAQSSAAGFILSKDITKPGTVLHFTANAAFDSADSFYLAEFSGSEYVGASKTIKIAGLPYLPFIKGMTKTN